ncbi:MAG: 4Fe-4S dicluster domain-containing protein [Sphingomonas sp.]
MKISEEKCVGCGNCTYACTMGAIYIDPKTRKATVNSDECVECYACYNGLSKEHLPPKTVRFTRRMMSRLWLRFEPDPDICPTDALVPDELSWPRVVRRAFSDPRVPHESTGVTGRGTEEVKTNEISNRIAVGMVGFTIEFGRPGVGVRFHQIQEMSMALAALGVKIQPKNPVTAMMSDVETGKIRDDILNEKVLSAILEITVPVERTEEIIRTVWAVEKRIDTIVVLGVGTRCDEDGEERVVAPILESLGYTLKRAKTNLGLGRPQIRELARESAEPANQPKESVAA